MNVGAIDMDESVVGCRWCYVHVGVVSGFEFEGDVRTHWLKLVVLRCDYKAEYTNTLGRGMGGMRWFAVLVLIQVLGYRKHCAVEENSTFIIIFSFISPYILTVYVGFSLE